MGEGYSYSVTLTRNDPATGKVDRIEIDSYGLLSELFDDLEEMIEKAKWNRYETDAEGNPNE